MSAVSQIASSRLSLLTKSAAAAVMYSLDKLRNRRSLSAWIHGFRVRCWRLRLIAGLLSIGASVVRIGVVSTPAVAYLTRVLGADAGVMISASHNPVEDNGIKFFGGDGFKLSDETELEIERLMDAEIDELPRPEGGEIGTVTVDETAKRVFWIS